MWRTTVRRLRSAKSVEHNRQRDQSAIGTATNHRSSILPWMFAGALPRSRMGNNVVCDYVTWFPEVYVSEAQKEELGDLLEEFNSILM